VAAHSLSSLKVKNYPLSQCWKISKHASGLD
jgi:hypothetical protein